MVWTGLLIGFVGSLHCAGMCGPLAIALPKPDGNKFKWFQNRLTYNFGRIFTYAMLGGLAGLAGQGFSMAGIQQWVSIFLGALLMGVIIFPAFKLNQYSLRFFQAIANPVRRKLGKMFNNPSPFKTFLFGLINGLLPCGLVYVALAGALTVGNYLEGIIFMILFGLGTFPMMMAISMAGSFISPKARYYFFKAVPVFTFLLGGILVLRGLNLGIPFISPVLESVTYTMGIPLCQ